VFSTTEIKAVKLLGGEVIIGYVTESIFSNTILIQDAQLCVQQVVEDRMEINLATWLPYAREYNFVIPKKQIVTMFKVRPNLETNYKVATGN
tara:strand:- start:12318 stop:12593 length:276 start_codon:yes stop_codon:yes gene_type:complete